METTTNNKKLPEGMRDTLFGDVLLCRDIEKRLSKAYLAAGFRQIMTPAVEYMSVFDNDSLGMLEESMYKLTDNGGHLAVLRADNTMPMARVAATKLRNEPLPLKLYYDQKIYRINNDYSGHRSEILQSGVEFIGVSGLRADLIILTTALEALKSLGTGYKLEIGNAAFCNALIEALGLDEKENRKVKALIDTKNTVSLGNSADGANGIDKIRRIPLLFGGSEVFAEAKELAAGNEAALSALDYVMTLYSALDEAGWGDKVLIDLGIVNTMDYYTGAVFRGYIDGAGEPVLIGGRYDRLIASFGYDTPATGFAVNVGLVADTLSKSGRRTEYDISEYMVNFSPDSYGKAAALTNEYRAKGIRVELSPFDSVENTLEYARKTGIRRVAAVTNEKTEIIDV